MKAFKEWWKNTRFEGLYRPLGPDDYFDHMAPYNVGEEIWKAALEWVNNMLWLADGHVVNQVKERIEKEFNEETNKIT
jgi:hypothetical protein